MCRNESAVKIRLHHTINYFASIIFEMVDKYICWKYLGGISTMEISEVIISSGGRGFMSL